MPKTVEERNIVSLHTNSNE